MFGKSIDELARGENIIWSGKPFFGSFMAKSLLLFAIGLILSIMIFIPGLATFLRALSTFSFINFFLIIIMTLPIWFTLFFALYTGLLYNCTYYLFTDKRALIKTGLITTQISAIDFIRVQNVVLYETPIDKAFGTGTISFTSIGPPLCFYGIKDAEDKFAIAKNLSINFIEGVSTSQKSDNVAPSN